ncbi:hypothetical protein EIK77_004095 [Talaromyces pinophilus]|jgi:hypothetical protein|nr:hypothetical protein EIK77_004095 [Talaromyces pinophilus]
MNSSDAISPELQGYDNARAQYHLQYHVQLTLGIAPQQLIPSPNPVQLYSAYAATLGFYWLCIAPVAPLAGAILAVHMAE